MNKLLALNHLAQVYGAGFLDSFKTALIQLFKTLINENALATFLVCMAIGVFIWPLSKVFSGLTQWRGIVSGLAGGLVGLVIVFNNWDSGFDIQAKLTTMWTAFGGH